MNHYHAQPGEVIDLRSFAEPSAETPSGDASGTLAKHESIQIIRLVLDAGKEIPTHQSPGFLVVQCLRGRIEFTALGNTNELEPGKMLYLPPHEPHSVRCIESGSLLLTLLTPRCNSADEVQEASEESFPASDSPGWTGVTS